MTRKKFTQILYRYQNAGFDADVTFIEKVAKKVLPENYQPKSGKMWFFTF